MEGIDIVILLILAVVIGCAAGSIYRAKKSGQKCVGCPHSGSCGGCHCDR